MSTLDFLILLIEYNFLFLFKKVLLFYNDQASFKTLIELMKEHARRSKLQEQLDSSTFQQEVADDDQLSPLLYHIELVQLLGKIMVCLKYLFNGFCLQKTHVVSFHNLLFCVVFSVRHSNVLVCKLPRDLCLTCVYILIYFIRFQINHTV